MNSLCIIIEQWKLDPVKAMNGLQLDAGIISDECVEPKEVASRDCFAACKWVLDNKESLAQ